ncbi:MAG: Crp/Fnr family transcriptional regulator [Desulfobacteraceae bacterium]
MEIISSTPLFKGLKEDHLTQLISVAERRGYKKGELIFSEGDEADGFYIVETGKIKVYKLSFEGKEHILHIYGPGKPFGEVPVFSGKNFPAFSQAVEPSSCLFFPRRAIVQLISDNPALALNMLAVLSARLREFTVMVENLALKEVPARIASYFLVLIGEQENTAAITLPVSKVQLAGLLGTAPETLSRILGKMANDNLIRLNNKEITILDLDGLEALAG